MADEKENQIGCGYCSHEYHCTKYDPRVNKARLGCQEFQHWTEADSDHIFHRMARVAEIFAKSGKKSEQPATDNTNLPLK